MDAKEKAQIEFDALLERLAKPSTLRLHLGEMTAQELRTSQATVRFVLSQMDRATPFLTSILAQSAQSDADDSTALLQQAYELTRYAAAPFYSRSEEHTSELQSLMRISYAVFCLKKKKKLIHYQHIDHILSYE